MLKTDQYIAHYHILEKLGQGGMGVVYKARDTRLDRYVALKFLPPVFERDTSLRERLHNEARAIASLNHPNITSIYAIEEHDDQAFIVMEYIDGKELKSAIQEKRLTSAALLDIAKQLAAGLAAAHDNGVIHRDIKSANIMLTLDNRIKIMDFGLAKSGALAELTVVGTTMGTASYMSPEQAMGHEVSPRSDIWSLGVVLYELATGTLPFSGAYEPAIIYALLNDDPRPVNSFRDDLPAPLLKVIDKCIQRDPEQRYNSMHEIIADLDAVVSIPLPADTSKPITPAAKTWRLQLPQPIKRKPYSIMVPVVIILVTLVWTLFRYGPPVLSGPHEQHVLVLPFTHIGGDEQMAAFCDGMVETLSSKLTQMERYHSSLWVVPSGEVRKNQISSPGEANKIFGANLAITGSMQFIDDDIRLTLNLVDTQKLRQLHSEVIDMQRSKILQLQERTVSILMEMLNLRNTKNKESEAKGYTTNPDAYEFYLKGRGYLQRSENPENIDMAVDFFKRAIDLDTKFALAYAGLGKAHWLQYTTTSDPQWVPQAIAACETATQLQPNQAQVCITLGMVQAGTGKYRQALDSFDRAVALEPGNADAYRGLARTYEALNMLPEAVNTYYKAIQLKPDYWLGYNNLGVFYFQHGQYDSAAVQFEQVIRLTPNNYRGYNNLGGMYYLQKKWQQAKTMFERAIELKTTYGAAANLGTLYYIEGKYDKAVAMYELAANLNGHNYQVWGNLASAYQWANADQATVLATYRHAINLAREQLAVNAKDPVLLALLASYYSMTGQVADAKQYIESALKQSQDNVEVLYRAATVYEQLGNREVALYWIEKALNSGFSLSEVESQPELESLSKDTRFQNLVANR